MLKGIHELGFGSASQEHCRRKLEMPRYQEKNKTDRKQNLVVMYLKLIGVFVMHQGSKWTRRVKGSIWMQTLFKFQGREEKLHWRWFSLKSMCSQWIHAENRRIYLGKWQLQLTRRHRKERNYQLPSNKHYEEKAGPLSKRISVFPDTISKSNCINEEWWKGFNDSYAVQNTADRRNTLFM